MVFVAAQGCASATMQYQDTTTGEHIGENVLTFEKVNTEDYTEADLIALAGALGQWWADEKKTIHSSACRYQQVMLRGLDSQAAATYTGLAASVGTVLSARMPSNVSLAVQFKTGLSGRSQRGRAYLTGIPLNAQEEDNVSAAYGLEVLTTFEDLDSYLPAGMRHVVISKYSNGMPRLSAQIRAVTSYALADYRLDTRRARISG